MTPEMQARKDAILGRNKSFSFGLCQNHHAPATMKDAAGNVWCSACQVRYDLIQWGYAHHYPTVSVHPYTIAEGEGMWKMIVIAGRTDAIETIVEGLHRIPDDEVSA